VIFFYAISNFGKLERETMASPAVRKSNEKVENVISAGEGLIDKVLGDVGKYSATKQLIIGSISGW
jgi:hypothetical protein